MLTPADNFGLAFAKWTRLIELIDEGHSPKDIATRMELDLATVMAVGKDYQGLLV